MKAQFLTLSKKQELYDKLKQGDKAAIKAVIDEIQRLESIILNYESAFDFVQNKLESTTFKTPNI